MFFADRLLCRNVSSSSLPTRLWRAKLYLLHLEVIVYKAVSACPVKVQVVICTKDLQKQKSNWSTFACMRTHLQPKRNQRWSLSFASEGLIGVEGGERLSLLWAVLFLLHLLIFYFNFLFFFQNHGGRLHSGLIGYLFLCLFTRDAFPREKTVCDNVFW